MALVLGLGTTIKEVFEVIDNAPLGPVFAPLLETVNLEKCCFMLPALAESSFTNALKNDFHSPFFYWSNAFTTADMQLQEFTNGEWSDLVALVDNTYGRFFTYGTYGTIEPLNGYQLQWSLVLSIHGEGTYRVKSTGAKILGGTLEKYSLDFCLKEYTDARAENSVVIDWTLTGSVGDEENDELRKDYANLGWINQLRLPNAMFSQTESEFSTETTKYQNGSMTQTSDNQVEGYLLQVASMPNTVIRFLRINAFQAFDLRFTDYNSKNPTPMTNKKVTEPSGFEQTLVAGVDKMKWSINFKPKFQNFTHKRC
jgi:hypothetical protein